MSTKKNRKNVFFLLTILTDRGNVIITMKITNGKLTAEVGLEAKKRLLHLQAVLLDAGCSARSISPGKIVAELLTYEGAEEYLKMKLPEMQD